MAPRITTGLNTVTRRLADGTKLKSYYDRRTGQALGSDRNLAIEAALSDADVLPSLRLTRRLDGAIYDHRLALGEAGETLVRSELVAAGLIVCMPSAGAPYDLIVDDGRLWRVQVKTRDFSGRSCAFLLFARGRGVAPVPRDYHTLGVDILALVSWRHRAVAFVDAREAAGRKSVVMPVGQFTNQEPIGVRWERAVAAAASPQPMSNRSATKCNIVTE